MLLVPISCHEDNGDNDDDVSLESRWLESACPSTKCPLALWLAFLEEIVVIVAVTLSFCVLFLQNRHDQS